jgi:hypothetical protein
LTAKLAKTPAFALAFLLFRPYRIENQPNWPGASRATQFGGYCPSFSYI